jgi:cyclase
MRFKQICGTNFLSQKPNVMCLVSSIVLLGALAAAGFPRAQAAQRGGQNAAANGGAQAGNADSGDIHLLRVRGNITMVTGAGGNITVQAGDQGILLVNTGLATMTPKILAAIRPLSPKAVAYIINTDDREDDVGGNAGLVAAGQGRGRGGNIQIISYISVLYRLNAPVPKGQTSLVPESAWPNDTFSEPQRNLHFNGEAVEISHQAATTDGNVIVLFRGSDVVSTGDIFDPTQYPIIDVKAGGSIQGVIEGLNRLKEMVVPENHFEGGTMVIPGHGRLCDAADVAVYQQMVTIIRDRLRWAIKKGMTLEQIKAAKLTQDYDPIYGSNSGNWTTDMFIEAAYNSLNAKQQSNGGDHAVTGN